MKNLFKRFWIGLCIAMLTCSFVACSDDDSIQSNLSGTTWVVEESTNLDFSVGEIFTFAKDGTLPGFCHEHLVTWKVSKGVLTIVDDEDFWKGPITIDGEEAVWEQQYGCEDELEDEVYVLKLRLAD